MTTAATLKIIDVELQELSTRYECLRLVRPREYALVRNSIQRLGQLHPVIVGETEGGYELVDGFKRYRACVDLGKSCIRAQVMDGGLVARKAAIITLNRSRGSLHAFEEALVVRSLYRDDKLNQQQIATLFGRHKSWACRRIALCERLSDEAIQEIRLGLLGFASAREIGRLPRGNQGEALTCIHKHHLSSRETVRLVSRLLQSPRWEHENYLHLPLDILDDRRPPRSQPRYPDAAETYRRLIGALERSQQAMEAALGQCALFDATQRNAMIGAVDAGLSLLSQLAVTLKNETVSSICRNNTV